VGFLFSLLGIEFPVPGSNISHGLKSLKCSCLASLDRFEELTVIRTGSCTLPDPATEDPVTRSPGAGAFLLRAVRVWLAGHPLRAALGTGTQDVRCSRFVVNELAMNL